MQLIYMKKLRPHFRPHYSIALALFVLGFASSVGAEMRELLLFQDIPLVSIASKKPQRVVDSPVPVIVIEEAEIELSGATNVPDLLRRFAGIDVLAVSASDHNVSIRGFNQQTSSRVLVLIDGRPVYLDFYGFVIWDALPVSMDEIERIEIVKGPGSSMYGGNALNGVINIITKSPEEIDGTAVAISGGEYDTLAGSIMYGRKSGATGYKFSFSRDEYDEWEQDGSYKYSDSAYFMIERDLARSSSLTLSGSIDQSEGETMTSVDNFFRDTTQSHLMVDYRAWNDLNLKLFWNGFDSEIEGERVFPYLEGFGVFKQHKFFIETDTYEAEMTKLFKAGKNNSLLIGGNYKLHNIDSDMFDDSHRQKIYGLFAEDEIRLGSALSATLGGRYDHHPLVKGNLSPRLGLVYSAAEGHMFSLSYTTAYGLPTFTQSYLYIEMYPPPTFALAPVRGNEELDVEMIKSTNFGYIGLVSDKLELNLDLFYNEIEDIVRFPDLSTDDRYRNVDSYTVRGAELAVKTKVTKALDFSINYAFLNIDYSDREGGFHQSPESKLNVGLNYTSEKLFGSIYAHYVSKTRWPEYEGSLSANPAYDGYDYDKVLDAYSMVNMNIGIKPAKGMTLSLYGYNIFNDRHKEDPLGDALGRKILAKMKFEF